MKSEQSEQYRRKCFAKIEFEESEGSAEGVVGGLQGAADRGGRRDAFPRFVGAGAVWKSVK